MGRKKSKCTIPQRGPNLVKRSAIHKSNFQKIAEQTERRYMLDTACLALNAEFGFGQERLERLMNVWLQKYRDYQDAFTLLPEADYKREQLDSELRRIMGADAPSFTERYRWVVDVHTGVKKD